MFFVLTSVVGPGWFISLTLTGLSKTQNILSEKFGWDYICVLLCSQSSCKMAPTIAWVDSVLVHHIWCWVLQLTNLTSGLKITYLSLWMTTISTYKCCDLYYQDGRKQEPNCLEVSMDRGLHNSALPLLQYLEPDPSHDYKTEWDSIGTVGVWPRPFLSAKLSGKNGWRLLGFIVDTVLCSSTEIARVY
jgi:hypothetical protein